MRSLIGLVFLLAIGLVVAACGTPPTTVPTLAPESVMVRIAHDGSGDFTSLQAAVNSVPPGSTLVLDAGVHELASPLVVQKPLNLVGAGMDQTELTSTAEGYVAYFKGDGPFVVDGITSRHEGNLSADVVVVQGGEVVLTGCRLTGSQRAEGEAERAGLRLVGSTVATIRTTEAIQNTGIGILVADDAQMTLESSTCHGNEMKGIALVGSAKAVVRQTNCLGSQIAGIHVSGQGQITLEDSTLGQNGSGIAFLDQSTGLVRKNEFSSNDFVGISVGNNARPVLEENRCSGNQYGIVFAGFATGSAVRNEVSQNVVGLLIDGTADPTLQENNVHENENENILDLRP